MGKRKVFLLSLLTLVSISFGELIDIDENNKSIQITTDKNKVGGHNDIIIGNKAGSGYDNKGDNVMIGLFAGKESKGRDNVYLGNEAGKKVDGSQNIEIGHFYHKGAEKLDKIVSIGYYSKVKYNTGASIGFFSSSDRNALTKKAVSENPSLEKEEVYALKSASDADKEAILKSLKIYENKQFKINGLAAFSVGNKIDTRQIIHVSPGTNDDDAVNLAQLKAVGNKVDSISEKLETWGPNFYTNSKVNGNKLSGDEIKDLDEFGKLEIYFGEGIKAENMGKGLLISLDENSGGTSKKYIDDKVKNLTSAIAGSYAIASIPQVTQDKLFSVGAATGFYNGKSAVAIGISGQNSDRNFVYKASVSVGDEQNIGVGVGVSLSLGKVKKEGTKVVELVKENPINNKLLERIEALEKEISRMKEKESVRYTIDNFALDSDKISEEQKVKLREIVDLVNSKFLNKTIVIIGHADIRHNEGYNLDLGMRRAREAKKALIKLGISSDVNIILKSSGYNERVEGDYRNQRRVEILINDFDSYR